MAAAKTRAKSVRKALNGISKGKRMSHGSGWTLVHRGDRLYTGTLLHVFNHGNLRLACFSVPKKSHGRIR